MRDLLLHWQPWAFLSAMFAALTAIFAKVGVEGVSSDLATFIRTIVVLVALGLLLVATGQLQPVGLTRRTLAFLVLSGLATGASWLCYFRALSIGQASQVAPVDKLSVVLVAVFGATMLGEDIAPRAWAGIGLIFVGVVLVAVPTVAVPRA